MWANYRSGRSVSVWGEGVGVLCFSALNISLSCPGQERRQEYQDKVFSVYHKYSCIRFVEWTPTLKEELGHNNHLIFEETNK